MTEPTVHNEPTGSAGPTEPDRPDLPELDAAQAHLDAAAQRPLAEQVEAYEAVHRTLQETLASIDQT